MDCLEMTADEMRADLETFERFTQVVLYAVLGLCGAGVVVAMILH
jgi:hypothetical protein